MRRNFVNSGRSLLESQAHMKDDFIFDGENLSEMSSCVISTNDIKGLCAKYIFVCVRMQPFRP